MSVSKEPLRVGVLGMDDKARSIFEMYLQGPCKRCAVVTEPAAAQVSIVDMDGMHAKKILAEEKERQPGRPVILLSLAAHDEPGMIYVRKPIQADRMTSALNAARQALDTADHPASKAENRAASQSKPRSRVVVRERRGPSDSVRGAAHRTAMLLDEKGYSAMIGSAPDIDPSDPHQVKAAYYDPRRFLQAYVQSAVRLAAGKSRILCLNTGWKPIIIFPHSREVWVDADDKQLRAFCVVPVNAISTVDVNGSDGSSISVTPVNGKPPEIGDPARLQSIDAFIWKLALWTSAGRVPIGTDLRRPVYLERWPNMTRCIVIPHALRIAALLIEQPRALPNIAEVLQIRQHYVFAFFSAARALGIAGQIKTRSRVTRPTPPAPVNKRSGVLRKILTRLVRR